MDSKPIAIVMSIVITVGALGAVAVFGSDALTGAMSTTSMTPKTMQILYVGAGQDAVANLVMTNQGSSSLEAGARVVLTHGGHVVGSLASGGAVEPYGTATFSGSLNDTTGAAANATTRVYPGDEVIAEFSARTTAGELVRNLFTVIVR